MELVQLVTNGTFAVIIAAYLIWDVTTNRRELKQELTAVRQFVQTEMAEMNLACQTALNRVADVLSEFTGRNR